MRKVLLVLVFIYILVPRIFSLELELTGGLGNLAFDKDRTSPLGDDDPAKTGAFGPHLFPLAMAQLSGEFKGFSYSAGFERDSLLRNRLFANVGLNLDYFSLEAGPVFGIFNSSKLPINPGISMGLGLEIPGIIFIRAHGSSTLGIFMDRTDNYFQQTGDLSAGFWVPYVICSLNMSVRNFTQREQANLLIEDELIRYFFRADVYTKNIPYTIRVDLGYQSLSRSYMTQSVSGTDIVKDTATDELKSVFMGLEGSYTFSPALKFLLAGEMPVYSWSVRPMKDPSKNSFLFQASIGIIWTIAQ